MSSLYKMSKIIEKNFFKRKIEMYYGCSFLENQGFIPNLCHRKRWEQKDKSYVKGVLDENKIQGLQTLSFLKNVGTWHFSWLQLYIRLGIEKTFLKTTQQ